MTYGYVRVSTDKQRVDNQEYEITRFCTKNSITIDEWIKETISGTKTPDKRKLGSLLDKIQTGDLIICAELSRLGRSLFMIMSILNKLMAVGAKVWTIKDNYRLGDDIQSKVLAFAFGLSAEIERDLISQRTKEALALRRAEGVIIGRPRGSIGKGKLDSRKNEVIDLLKQGYSYSGMQRIMGMDRMTISYFCKKNDLLKHRKYEEKDKRGLKKMLPKAFEVIGFNTMKKHIKAGLTYLEIGGIYKIHQASIRKYVQSNEVLFELYKNYHTKIRLQHNSKKEILSDRSDKKDINRQKRQNRNQ
jgi:DNA invertase Pin-like site-specific DNA recombinase